MLQRNTSSEIRQFWHRVIINFDDCPPEQSHSPVRQSSENLSLEPINEIIVSVRVNSTSRTQYALLSRTLARHADTTVTTPSFTDEVTASVLLDEPASLQAEAQYQTVWGNLTFTELHERTRRYAAHMLREDSRYRDNDVDDGLQVAYLKLWQRLQAEPKLLVGRGIAWIGKFLFYGAVHTRQKEHRLSKRQVEAENDHAGFVDSLTTASGVARPHSHESRQADIRIDLHAAIVTAANYILMHYQGLEQIRALWALYCIVTLDLQVTAASQLFRVHHRAMKQAYEQVVSLLRQHLRDYQPRHETRPIRASAQQPQAYQDICAIRRQNANIPSECFDKVRKELEQQCPDTLDRDLAALEGIQGKVSAKAQAIVHGTSYSAMQRAYERIHLLLGSQRDEAIIPRRPQKIRAKPFVFCPEYEPLIQSIANEMLSEPNCQGKLIALYSYLCNIPNRASARNFQMSEATLRNYRQHIQERFAAVL